MPLNTARCLRYSLRGEYPEGTGARQEVSLPAARRGGRVSARSSRRSSISMANTPSAKASAQALGHFRHHCRRMTRCLRSARATSLSAQASPRRHARPMWARAASAPGCPATCRWPNHPGPACTATKQAFSSRLGLALGHLPGEGRFPENGTAFLRRQAA
jgi:hypothetical protein